MNWNDELCGVKVTPENWAGGVVHWPGDDKSREGWAIAGSHVFPANSAHPHAFLGIDGWCYRCDLLTPIFPPKGWAGKTDAELWREVFGDAAKYLWRVPTNEGGNHACLTVNCDLAGGCFWMDLYADASELESEDATTLILALQNAQVLARRLA